MGALINEWVLLAQQQQIFVDHCAQGVTDAEAS
jgi:hypothetical protein